MKELNISNFRKITGEWNIELHPVTFLTGKNNSGKSTIIKSLLLLKDFFDSNNFFKLNFNGPNYKNHKITSFRNAINNCNLQKIKYDNILKFELRKKKEFVSLEFYQGEKNQGNLKKLEITDNQGYVFGIYSNLYYSITTTNPTTVRYVDNLPKTKSRERDYYIQIPDLTFNINRQQYEATVLLKKILHIDSKQRMQPLYMWFFENSDLKDIAYRTLGELLKKNKVDTHDLHDLCSQNFLKSESPILENIKNIENKDDYFDDIEFQVDNNIFLMTKKWNEESRIALYIFIDHYNYLPSIEDIYYFHNEKSNPLSSESSEENSDIVDYKVLLEKINKFNPKSNSFINKFTIDTNSDKIIENEKKHKYENLEEYIREVIWDVTDEIKQSENIKQENKKFGNRYFRNARLLSNFIERARSLNISYLSPFKYYQSNYYSLYHKENETQLNVIKQSNQLIKDKEDGKNYLDFVTKWMKEFEIGNSFKFKDIKTNNETLALQILISDSDNKLMNLKDKGLGSGQVFFMILNVANLRFSKQDDKYKRINTEKLLLIEEPECNLHPALQSKLAELFYDLCYDMNNDRQSRTISLIAETHSEYIIRKSQNIVKNQINAKDIFKTYYIKDEDNNEPESLDYNDNGTFKKSFGKGFFDESSNLTLDLF